MAHLTTFHQFASLPTELRFKIWKATLPSRVIEPELDYEPHLLFGEHNGGLGMRRRRKLPTIFHVNGESRAYCLEQYVSFANTFIHPKLDILFFSRDEERKFWLYSPSFHHVSNHPVSRLRSVAIEVHYDGLGDFDFAGHLYWMKGLGCPQQLIICPVSTNVSTMDRLSYMYQSSTETESDAGNKTHFMGWPREVDGEMVQQIVPKLSTILQAEGSASFLAPKLHQDLYFAESMF